MEVNKLDFSKFLDYPSINCSNKQEWMFIKKNNEKMLSNFVLNESFQKNYLYFKKNEKEKVNFFKNSDNYIEDNKISLSKKECLALKDLLKTSSDSTDNSPYAKNKLKKEI